MTPSSEAPGSTSSGLLARVKGQDQDAWRKLVRLYGPLIDFWVRRAGVHGADAEDVFQEVFRAVASGIGGFRKDRPTDSFRGWLRIITRSKVVDHFRRQENAVDAVGGSDARHRIEALPEVEEASEVPEFDALRRRAVELVRAEFEEHTWQAFWRTVIDEQPTRAVADDLGMTPEAVRMARLRVLRRLREEMEGLDS